jgi:hypothetical protein
MTLSCAGSAEVAPPDILDGHFGNERTFDKYCLSLAQNREINLF